MKFNPFASHRIVLGAAALLCAFGFSGCEDLTYVETARSETRTLLAKVSESGVVQPDVEVPVAPDVSGEIVELHVVEGQEVKKGQLLFVVKPDNYKAAFEQATAALNTARADFSNAEANLMQVHATLKQDSINYHRNKALFEQKAISRAEFETFSLRFETSKTAVEASKQVRAAASYRIKSAEASVKQAKDNLDKTQVFASMDGTITALNAQLGQRVVGTGLMSGTEIVKIADLTRMEVEVLINENDIVNLHIGDTATVEVDAYPDRLFRGRVTEIAFSADKALLGTSDQVTNYKVKVLIVPESYLNDPALTRNLPPRRSPFRPGMSAVVNIFTQRVENVVSVPIQAVTLDREKRDSLNKNNQEVVFVYEGEPKKGTVRAQKVKSGVSDDNFIEIKEGLKSGVTVVSGSYTTINKVLKDGMEVTAEKKKDKKAKE